MRVSPLVVLPLLHRSRHVAALGVGRIVRKLYYVFSMAQSRRRRVRAKCVVSVCGTLRNTRPPRNEVCVCVRVCRLVARARLWIHICVHCTTTRARTRTSFPFLTKLDLRASALRERTHTH